MNTSLLIENAFDTARLVAFYRALETERSGALFHDPYARLLAGERGAEIVRQMPKAISGLWAIVLRTYIYDEMILRTIEQEGVDVVLNLAAGLDTRPYRLQLPSALRWIEIDHPDVLSYKEEKLAEKEALCQIERIPLDITDGEARAALFTKVNEEAKRVLVITEGLLIYLPVGQVASIAADLHKQEHIRWWLTEFVSPLALKRDENNWNALADKSAKVHFAPPGGMSFFQSHGWHAAEFRVPIEEALRLRLPIRFRWLWKIIFSMPSNRTDEQKQSLGGFVLLQREQQRAILEQQEMTLLEEKKESSMIE